MYEEEYVLNLCSSAINFATVGWYETNDVSKTAKNAFEMSTTFVHTYHLLLFMEQG
jgi:hypothetical protein